MSLLDLFRSPKPRPDREKGGSGRQHSAGFLDYDEINHKLRGRQGLKVFEEMWRTDGDCRRSLLAIMVAIVGGTWQVDPPGTEDEPTTPEEQEATDFLTWALFDPAGMSPQLPGHLLEAGQVAGRAGFAPFEQIWKRAQWRGRDVLTLKTLDLRRPQSVQRWLQDGPDLTGIEQWTPGTRSSADVGGVRGPVQIPAVDLVYYRFGPEGDNWEGASLLRPAYKHWWAKTGLEIMQMQALERSGKGIPSGYPPAGAGAEELDAFRDFLEAVGSDDAGYWLAPGPYAEFAEPGQGWFWEFTTPKDARGAAEAFKVALDYQSDKIAAAVLEEFMRQGMRDVGTNATAQTQQDPFMLMCEALASTVFEAALNEQLIPRMLAVNFTGLDRLPRLRCSLIDDTTLTDLADFVQKLSNAGALRPEPQLEDFLRKRADLPPADEQAIADAEQVKADREREMLDAKAAAARADTAGDGQPPPAAKTATRTLDAPMAINPGDRVAESLSDLSLGQHGTCTGLGVDERDGALTHNVQWDDGTTATGLRGFDLRRLRRQDRELRDFETHISLDRIETSIDGARDRFQAAAGPHVRTLAADLAARTAAGKDIPPGRAPDELAAAIEAELEHLYQQGRLSVREELASQGHGEAMLLAANPVERARRFAARARAAADAIRAMIAMALNRRRTLTSDLASLTIEAERAGAQAVREESYTHASAVVNTGRSDQADEMADVIAGSRYTSILDGNRCLAPEAQVTTRSGPKRAADITLDDALLTHSGRYVRPSAVIVSEVQEDLILVNAGGSTLRATTDHPVLVATPDGFIWREAGQLAVGDLVVSEASLQHAGEAIAHDVDLGQPPHGQTPVAEAGGLAGVGVAAERVPVRAVALDHEVADEEVDDPRTDLGLGVEVEQEPFEHEPGAFLDRGFGGGRDIAALGAVAAPVRGGRDRSEGLAAVRAVDEDRRPVALFGAVGAARVDVRPEWLAAATAVDRDGHVLVAAGDRAIPVAVGVGDGDAELALAADAGLGDPVGSALGRAVGGASFEAVGEGLAASLARRGRVLRSVTRAGLAGDSPALLSGTPLASLGAVGDAGSAVHAGVIHDGSVQRSLDDIRLLAVASVRRESYAGLVYDFTVPGDHTLWADGILVHNCGHCARADDDVLRPLTDPVRLARKPPNPDCEGGHRCRCIEAFTLKAEAAPAV